MRKLIGILLAAVIMTTAFVSCGGSGNSSNAGKKADDNNSADNSFKGTITVVSREEGSGTRGAFVELLGIEEKDADGNKIDNTTDGSEITNSTGVMLQTVAGNKSSIGYISLGSLNDSVKALKIDGTAPSAETVKDGSYKVSRPFNIVTKDGLSDAAKDFIDYILSEEGQQIVEKGGYISEGNNGKFAGGKASGKVKVSGSSSVTPIMEKLAEAYKKVNANVTIDVQQSDSTTGVTDAVKGNSDIGMASRELKDTETSQGVKGTQIALDGIAIVVNNDNPYSELTSEQVKNIYTGEITDWSQLG